VTNLDIVHLPEKHLLKSIRASVHSGKCPLTTFIRSGKCFSIMCPHSGKCTFRQVFFSQVSIRVNVHLRKCLSGKVHSDKCILYIGHRARVLRENVFWGSAEIPTKLLPETLRPDLPSAQSINWMTNIRWKINCLIFTSKLLFGKYKAKKLVLFSCEVVRNNPEK